MTALRSGRSATCAAVFVLALLFAGLPVRPVLAQSNEIVAEVTRLRGEAEAVQPGGGRRLAVGAGIFMTDTIRTGADTRIQIVFRDGTDLVLGDETDFRIDFYDFEEGGGSGSSVFSLVTGVFRMVTGAIASAGDPSVTITTPVATIGIRGIDLWGAQRPNRLRIGLFGGIAVIVTNAAGSVTLTDPGTLTVVTAPDAAPTPAAEFDPDDLARVLTTVEF